MDKEKMKRFLCVAAAVFMMIIPLNGSLAVYAEETPEESISENAADDVEENVGAEQSVEESSVSELDKFAYDGDDLGATYSKESTVFKVWSPTASRVQVLIYSTGSDDEENSKYLSMNEMDYDKSNGVWTATVKGDLLNKYYTYYVYNGKKGKETVDIYAKAAGVNGERGMIVDLPSGMPADMLSK